MTADKETASGESAIAGESTATGDYRIRFRAIFLGILLAALVCAITPFNNAYLQGTPLGGGHFPLAPFFVLIWMTLLVAAVPNNF